MEKLLREAQATAGLANLAGLMSADIDVSKMGPEAQAIWAHLDKLADDPRAYARFVRKAAEDMKAEETGRLEISPEPGFVIKITASHPSTAWGPPGPASSGVARPKPPADIAAGHPIYVNVAGTDRLRVPTDAEGKPVTELERAAAAANAGGGKKGGAAAPPLLPLPTLLSLNVSLGVGSLRAVRGTGRSEWAVDVLVHPWVLETAPRSKPFRDAVVALATSAVVDELGVQAVLAAGSSGEPIPEAVVLEDGWLYKGGAPVQGGGGEGGPAAATSGAVTYKTPAGVVERVAAFDLTPHLPPDKRPKGASSGGSGSSGGAMASPAALLQQVKAGAAAAQDEEDSRDAAGSSSKAGGKAGLTLPGGPPAGAAHAAAPAPKPEIVISARGLASGGGAVDVCFDPDVVALPTLKMAMVALDVAPTTVTLRFDKEALVTGSSDDVDPLVVIKLPAPVDVDSAAAKFKRAAGRLALTLATAAGGKK